jgi:hypothetical protein
LRRLFFVLGPFNFRMMARTALLLTVVALLSLAGEPRHCLGPSGALCRS